MKIDYIAAWTDQSIKVDGNISKQVWAEAAWSSRFVDMVDGGPSIYETKCAILWNTENLYVAIKIEEPFLSASKTERDSIVFMDNDIELFIDGGDLYYELEINALNTVYEVLFAWKDKFAESKLLQNPTFDLRGAQVYSFGGDYDRQGEHFWKGTHPRGVRWAFRDFDLEGLKTAVALEGTLNDNSDVDKGWSAEISIPWSSLEILANGRAIPPKDGDIWSLFLGRFQKIFMSGREEQPHPASSLTHHGVYDTHLPEKWSSIKFSK